MLFNVNECQFPGGCNIQQLDPVLDPLFEGEIPPCLPSVLPYLPQHVRSGLEGLCAQHNYYEDAYLPYARYIEWYALSNNMYLRPRVGDELLDSTIVTRTFVPDKYDFSPYLPWRPKPRERTRPKWFDRNRATAEVNTSVAFESTDQAAPKKSEGVENIVKKADIGGASTPGGGVSGDPQGQHPVPVQQNYIDMISKPGLVKTDPHCMLAIDIETGTQLGFIVFSEWAIPPTKRQWQHHMPPYIRWETTDTPAESRMIEIDIVCASPARRIDGREINELKYRGVVLNVVGHEMNQRAIALYAKFGLRHQKDESPFKQFRAFYKEDGQEEIMFFMTLCPKECRADWLMEIQPRPTAPLAIPGCYRYPYPPPSLILTWDLLMSLMPLRHVPLSPFKMLTPGVNYLDTTRVTLQTATQECIARFSTSSLLARNRATKPKKTSKQNDDSKMTESVVYVFKAPPCRVRLISQDVVHKNPLSVSIQHSEISLPVVNQPAAPVVMAAPIPEQPRVSVAAPMPIAARPQPVVPVNTAVIQQQPVVARQQIPITKQQPKARKTKQTKKKDDVMTTVSAPQHHASQTVMMSHAASIPQTIHAVTPNVLEPKGRGRGTKKTTKPKKQTPSAPAPPPGPTAPQMYPSTYPAQRFFVPGTVNPSMMPNPVLGNRPMVQQPQYEGARPPFMMTQQQAVAGLGVGAGRGINPNNYLPLPMPMQMSNFPGRPFVLNSQGALMKPGVPMSGAPRPPMPIGQPMRYAGQPLITAPGQIKTMSAPGQTSGIYYIVAPKVATNGTNTMTAGVGTSVPVGGGAPKPHSPGMTRVVQDGTAPNVNAPVSAPANHYTHVFVPRIVAPVVPASLPMANVNAPKTKAKTAPKSKGKAKKKKTKTKC